MSDVAFLLGQTVKELRYGVELRFVFDEGERVEPALYADLGPFTYSDPTGVGHYVDPDDPLSVAPVLELVGKLVKNASVKDDATLELRFSDRSSLKCPPNERYEAWQIVGGDPLYLVVAVGHGDVATFDRRTPQIGF